MEAHCGHNISACQGALYLRCTDVPSFNSARYDSRSSWPGTCINASHTSGGSLLPPLLQRAQRMLALARCCTLVCRCRSLRKADKDKDRTGGTASTNDFPVFSQILPPASQAAVLGNTVHICPQICEQVGFSSCILDVLCLTTRGFPKIRGTLYWGPYNKDPTS